MFKKRLWYKEVLIVCLIIPFATIPFTLLIGIPKSILLSSIIGWISVITYCHDLENTQESHYTKGADSIDFIIYWLELCC
jgi:hypothetical protein